MSRFAILFAISLGVMAQAQTGTTVAPIPPACPTSFSVAGLGYNSAATPRGSGFMAMAVPFGKCTSTFQPYWFSLNTIWATGNAKTFQFHNTTSTGFAYPVGHLTFGTYVADLYALGNVGVTLTANAPTLSGVFGGLGSFPVKSRLRVVVAAEEITSHWLFGGGVILNLK